MFEIGQKVVCVDNSVPPASWHAQHNIPSPLVVGKVYLVADVFISEYYWSPGRTTIRLHEQPNDWLTYGDIGWFPHRFRPLRKLDTSQSLKALIELADNCPALPEDAFSQSGRS